MIQTGGGYNVENYKDYRNRTVQKHLDKINNQLRQIRECSLKPEDKGKLISDILIIIENNKP